MIWLDWTVIAVYMVGMLAIGVYYARRTTSTEEYLLGGRDINSTSVGFSLFAALLSTISCLSVPGEMIQHGPMYFASLATYPLLYFIGGWLLIPVFMKLRVTSAYEILENRLGLEVRLVGSSLFLTMRLLWMGMIIFATTSAVIVPLTGLREEATPYICIVVGLVTVIYSSMGGLRAVVVTDVIQELIMFGAIFLTLVVISFALGGVGPWWPKQWMDHWDKLSLGADTTARVSLLPGLLSGMMWWICTMGSDQMAIQRYLATRDLKAARHALAVSLSAAFLAIAMLALVGLAVLAYFQAFPEMLAPNTNVDRDADKLFPRFIVVGFPDGLTGLVIAGLVATAMSSLSSGINASCSVIAVDFFDRLGRKTIDEANHVRRTKRISWIVGILTIIASTGIGYVKGNLLEVATKTVDLLVAPTFVLFFMALFVPWATRVGTIGAAAITLEVAVLIAFFEVGGLSFVWILPVSLLAGIVAGPLLSGLEHSISRIPWGQDS